ncbi:hypothetical protein BDN71DRAFT_1396304 [Pleurotus eryngii]|uniref:AIG1-type G domain-containing protein n=1 Tax=Pleurotus eryngii TaxID=5323 RepID=A0A9P6DEM4_PLEER|nr:hypothetical protein BDN71DRAFT_1396304 [Pleurotus eryngii]
MTILLIGETCVGKTSFLDLLANVCAGRVMNEFKEEHERQNEYDAGGRSQTKKPKLYRITCSNGSTINVIDTPGLSDPRGMEFDDEHKQAIADFIKTQIDAIDCVLIMTNGTVAHVSIPTRYTLSIISSMFPSSIVDNVALLFTMVPSPLHFNFKREMLPDAVRNAKSWCIDNPLVSWLRFQKAVNSGDLPEGIEEETRVELKHAYDKVLRVLNSFFEWVDERKVQPTKEVDELHRMSNNMEATLSNVLAHFTQAEAQKTELIKLQHELDNQKQIKKIHEHYQSVIIQRFYTQEGTNDAHNTLCCAPDCYRNCHLACPLEFTLDRDALGRNCEAFSKQLGPDGGYICNECGHSSNHHQHYRSRWMEREEPQVNVDEQAKRRYQQADAEEERIRIMEEYVHRKIKVLDASVAADMEELGSICEEYNKLSLSGSFVGYLSQAILLLMTHEQKMKQEGATMEALERISGHIKALERKRAILEQAAKEREARGAV